MRQDWTKGAFFQPSAIFGVALALSMLAGCADNANVANNVANAKQSNTGAQSRAAADTSTGAVKSKIAKICLGDPERFFGSASNPARCDCYGAGVTKTLSKDELSYVVTYNEIPSLSSNEYDKVKQRCLGGPATADDKPASKKKSAKEKS
jgi:hypothetical protein